MCRSVEKVPAYHQIAIQRDRLGLSQEQLGELVGRGARQIGRYENGQSEPPAETIVKMARALNVSADTLLDVEPTTRIAALPAELVINGERYVHVDEVDLRRRAAARRARA